MNEPDPNKYPNPWLTVLRIFLWLSPGAAIALCMQFASNDLFRIFGNTLHDISIIASLIGTGLIGYFDRSIALRQKNTPRPYAKIDLMFYSIAFMAAQIIIAPVIFCVVAFGICMITGSKY